jgi:hypothetical protein
MTGDDVAAARRSRWGRFVAAAVVEGAWLAVLAWLAWRG